jgi:hypothetical protein
MSGEGEAASDRVPNVEPTIRYAKIGGKSEFDEFIAHNATVHFEVMGETSFWMQIDVGGRSWHINCGAVSSRARGYARCDEVTA